MKKLLLILGLSLGLTASASAEEWTGKLILESREMPVISGYLNGVAQAYTFAIIQAERQTGPLYCQPDRIALTEDLTAEAIRIGGDIYGDDQHPAVLALYGLKEMFPCK